MSAQQNTGRRVVDVVAHRVELVEPWAAGEYDPTMQEWLQLPVSDSCPSGHDHAWGTGNPQGYLLKRRCHDCGVEFRGEVTAHTISEVVGALSGTPRRFGRGSVPPEAMSWNEQVATAAGVCAELAMAAEAADERDTANVLVAATEILDRNWKAGE